MSDGKALEIVAECRQLPSLPEIYLRVKGVVDDPDGSIVDLAQAMSRDAAMTARVLRIVNSPFYGFPGRVDTVGRAVNLLGMQQVHDLVLTWAISSAFAGVNSARLSMKAFWRGSLARAIAAKRLAKNAGFVDADRLFVEGLLSNIGRLVLYVQLPELAAQCEQRAKQSGTPCKEIERSVFGCDHAEVGAALVHAWSLPAAFEEPIRTHLNPGQANIHATEAAILNLAAAVAERLNGGNFSAADPLAVGMLSADDALLQDTADFVDQTLEATVAEIFPQYATQ